MPNRSHHNVRHIAMNSLRKRGRVHSSASVAIAPSAEPTSHIIAVMDGLKLLRALPDGSIQLVICDPPYNINVAAWDDRAHYADWPGNGCPRPNACSRRQAIS